MWEGELALHAFLDGADDSPVAAVAEASASKAATRCEGPLYQARSRGPETRPDT